VVRSGQVQVILSEQNAPGPSGRDHRPRRPQDDDQRPQLGGEGVHGRLRGRHLPHLVEPSSRGRSKPGRRLPADAHASTPARSPTGSPMRRRRWWSAPAAGTFPRSTCSSMGVPASGSLFDFGLYALPRGSGGAQRRHRPYFYLPKLESHLEARLWNDVFVYAQDRLGMGRGHDPGHRPHRDHPRRLRDGRDPLRAARPLRRAQRRTVGLHLLDDQEVRDRPDRIVLPDRAQVTMTVPFMRAYTELQVATCHRRGAHAIGGMAAFIPNRRDPEVTETALAKVTEDKRREAEPGLRRHLGGPPRPGPGRHAGVRRRAGRPTQPAGTARPDVAVTAETSSTPVEGGDHRGRPAHQRLGRDPLPGLVADGEGRRRHRQPDGGRRHRRDLALADLAVGPHGGEADDGRVTAELVRAIADEETGDPNRWWETTPTPPLRRGPRSCSSRSLWATSSSSSSPCPPTS
jgi:hypothetical protein